MTDRASVDGGDSSVVGTRVAIVGSGFGGLGAAIRLKAQGVDDFLVLERSPDLGGTWLDNSYPGCACDVESHLYSFSFALNPDWSRRFSPQPEIWEYLRRCAERYDVVPHVRFGHDVRSATWDEGAQRWRVETSRGTTVIAPVLVLASGALSDAVVPPLPGLETFRGRTFHSAHWDHGYDLAGKRVAVIGTGASAIQFVPAIQPKVAALHLFQRTAPWVMPRHDRPIRAGALYRRLPLLQRAVRAAIYAHREAFVLAFRSPRVARVAERVSLRHLRRQVPDAALRTKLTPRFTMGCKRVLLSDDYYPAVSRPNVELVTAGVAEVREHSIVGGDGVERPVDAIVFGTGFRPTSPPLAPHVRGRGGRTLAEAWEGSPKAHVGVTVAGFPNLFMLMGPNTGLGHSSVVYMIEAQLDHLLGALRYMRSNGVTALEPRPEAQARFVAEVDHRSRGTVWTGGRCASWYLDATGRNSTLWPDLSWRYRRRAARMEPADYVVTRPHPAEPRAPYGPPVLT